MQWLWAIAALGTMALLLGLCYRPLGDYMAWVFTAEHHWKVERAIYRLVGVNPRRDQSWQAYLRAILVFSAVGFVMLYLLQRCQAWLPFSLGHGAVPPDLAFNTAASFVGNTNWQAYSPEHTMGYTVQMAGLAVQSFVSSAVGIAVSIALVRGLAARRSTTVGNFWVDLVRANLRLLLPGSILAAIVLMAGGVVQNLTGPTDITTLSGALQSLPGGPVASQEAIKMFGTNGGGFFNANSAHPFENPAAWTNLFQIFLLLVSPFALPRTFGTMTQDRKLGRAIAATMVALFTAVYAAITYFELSGDGTAAQLAGAAMEGKEDRFGIIGSTLFATATTGTSGGAANSMHESYTAGSALFMMIHMLLGELSPGGVGAGLYTIVVMAVIAVFLTGLLLGRAPIFVGKRIGLREVKLASLVILVMPILALAGMAASFAIPSVRTEMLTQAMTSDGPRGMSEVMYAFISCAINNGSSFAGFDANTPYLNTVLGVIILLGRFVVIALVMAMAGAFAAQDRVPLALTELPLHRAQFIGFLVAIIVFIAVPTFLPVLTLGPLAEGRGGP